MWNFPPRDIFVAHSSPRFIQERGEEVHVGFDAFVRYVLRTKPKFLIYGHQHLDQVTQLGETTVICILGKRLLAIEQTAICSTIQF